MATNSALSSEAGLVELFGRECYNDYFNKAVGGDSIMGVGDISANVVIFDNACAMESIIDELLLEAATHLNCTRNSRALQQIPPHLFTKVHDLLYQKLKK